MTDDFTVSFGSNARAWAQRLKRDLEPAKNEIIAVGQLLQGLERQADKSIPAVTAKLAQSGGAGGAGGTVGIDTRQLEAALDAHSTDLKVLSTVLGKLVTAMDRQTAAENRRDGQKGRQDQWRDPSTGRVVPAGTVGATAFRGMGVIDPKFQATLDRIARSTNVPTLGVSTTPTPVKLTDVSNLQIDQGSIDRIVRAVHDVRDAVKAIGTLRRGGTSEPEPSAAVDSGAAKRKGTTAKVDTDDLKTREDVLRRQIAELEVGNQRIASLMEQAGLATSEEMSEILASQREAQSKLKAELAALERETTGVTRSDQKAARQAEYSKRPDLPDYEYDRRKEMLRQIRATANPEAFMGGIGTGAGQLRKADLRTLAQQFKALGFDPNVRAKDTTAVMGEKLIAAGGAYRAQWGAEVPPELQTGRRIVSDKVGDSVRSILEAANVSAAEAAEEFKAREAIKLARQVGYLPKDPTEELTQVRPMGESAITVPRGMVKGAGYDDSIFNYEASQELLRQRALGRAANLAQDPSYDPFKVRLKDEVEGQGEEAINARMAFRALRQATRELDDLGREFATFSEAIDQNEGFIERATRRLNRLAAGDTLSAADQKRVVTDPANIAAAQENIERLQAAMASQKFKGLQETFEDPIYQEGRQSRDITRAQQDAWIKEREERERTTNVNDAMGQAVVGTRLAARTKDTYIRNIPGLAYDPYKLEYKFQDPDRDPAQLTDLNQAARSYSSGARREALLAEEIEKGDRPQADLERQMDKTENALAKFLNQLQQVMGVTLPAARLLPQTPWREGRSTDIFGEERRLGQIAAVNAERDRKLPKQTPEQLLAGAQQAEKVAKSKLTEAETRLAKVDQELATVSEREKKARQKMVAALDVDARAAYDDIQARQRRAVKAEQSAFREFNSLASQMPYLKKEMEGQFGDRRASTGAYLDPFKRNALGYDADLGYGPSEAQGEVTERLNTLNKAEAELLRAERELRTAVGAEESTTERLTAEKRRLETDLVKLRTTVQSAAARTAQYTEELRGVSSKVPATKGVTAGAPGDAETLRRQIDEGVAQRRKMTDLRAQKKKAEGDELAGIQAQIDQVRQVGIPTKRRLKEMRKQLYTLEQAEAAAGGAGAGGGKKPPTAGGAAYGGGDSNSILRDILTVLNGIHRTLQTGVKTTGGGTGAARTPKLDENGNPVPPKPRVTQTASREELAQARSNDPRQQALAQASQRRRLEILKESDVLRAHTAALQEDARRERENADGKRKASKIATAAAHAQLQLSQALRLIDQSAAAELATLRKMNKEGADATRIAEQQAKAYAAVNHALRQSGVMSANDRRPMIQSLMGDAGSRLDAEALRGVAHSARGVNGFKVVDDAMAGGVPQGGVFGEHSAFTQAMFGNSGFWSRVMHSTGTFIVRNFTAGFVFGLTNALQDIIYQGIITESTFIRVSDALEQTGRSSGNLRTQLQAISSQYGVALNDVYMTAAGLTGLFDDIDDIAGATKVVAQLQAISMGALNAQEAMGVLASITGAYGDDLAGGVDGLTQVADTLTVIQNTLGTNVEVTSEGVGRLSGLSKQLNIDFQDTATYVAQIAKLTNQTGAAAGEQFSRILASMQSGRGRAAIAEALPDSGISELIGSGEYGQAIQVLLKEWDGLSESQQRNLTVTIAGQRQAAAFAALMNNSSKVLNTAAEAHDANGEAAQRAERIANTLNGQIQRLMTNLQNLAQNLVRTGILNFFGVLLKVTNQLLSIINKVFSVANDVADSNPFLRLMKDMAAGVLGLILTLKLGTMAFAGFKASMRNMAAGDGVMAAGIAGAQNASRPSIVGGTTNRLDAFAQARIDRANALSKNAGGTVFRQDVGVTQAPRVFAVGANGIAEQKELTKATQAGIRANNLAARAATSASKGVGALAGAGLGLNAAMLVAAVGIGVIMDELGRISELQSQLEGIRKQYDEETGSRLSAAAEEKRYVGPATDLAEQNRKDTSGWANEAQNFFTSISAPFHSPLDTAKNDPTKFLGFGIAQTIAGRDEWKGILSEQMQGQLDSLTKGMEDALGEFDHGGERATNLRGFYESGQEIGGKAGRNIERALAENALPNVTVDQAEAAGVRVGRLLDEARKDIFKQYDDGEINEAQQAEMLAKVEAVALETNDRVAAIILRARGIAEADNLSMEMIKNIDQARSAFSNLQGSSVLSDSGEFTDALIKNTGVREGSAVDRRLRKLAEGGLSRVQAMKLERKLIEEESENAQAKYLAALSSGTLEPEQVEEYKTEALNKMAELHAKTEEIIQGFVDTSTVLAEAAIGQGNYARGRAALDRALAQMAAERAPQREFETPELRAQRDVREQSVSSQAAQATAQGLNARLQLAKARNQGSVKDAQIEAQIAQNEYFALRSAQAAAQIAGAQGPPKEALRQAKIAWVQAEQAAGIQAQQLNIAQMVLAAAGIWNGLAAAQAQEGIAMQQWKDAKKNFGAKSLEALGMQTAMINAQKATASTADQVAQAQRDAALAAIPQGNAVAVAQQGVANAQAALAAASKYGTNSVEYQGALSQLYAAQQQAQAAQAAVAVAQAQLAQAYADARGDAVAAARAGVAVARAALAAALQASGGARSAEVLGAQAQLVAANAAVGQAQADLVASRVRISIALADAAGDTTRSAMLQLKAARIALAFARRRSGGEATAEVNAAKAEVIAAEAAARDAELQDRLDTIDFNLEMGKMTQSAAIAALREILKTADLTKQQRRQLLLQIKGMKDEMADSLWNFGDIKTPTPYQMRRYIEQRKDDFRGNLESAARTASADSRAQDVARQGGTGVTNVDNSVQHITFKVNGADIGEVKKIIREVVGTGTRTRTTGARRR